MNPRVRDVVPRDDHRLEITFANGEVRIFDCSHLLDFGVFTEFQDLNYFKQARVEGGTVVWPHEQDICPNTRKTPVLSRISISREERVRMSEAAVVIVRIKRVFSFLRERGATSPESAIPESEVPYSDRWYYGRLIEYGAVKRVGGRCYLDENLARAYLTDWRKRAFGFLALAALAFAVLWLIWALLN